MSQGLTTTQPTSLHFAGLRMSADEFFQLPDDGHDYELLDGVVIMTPSPAPLHQRVSGEIFWQVKSFLKSHRIGEVFQETDVHLGEGPGGGDLVYRPEIVFYRTDRLTGMEHRLVGPPDVVVEVISPQSHRYDTQTKRDDYERCGVGEYWIVDPQTNAFTFLRNESGSFQTVPAEGETFRSKVLDGFTLDLAEVRKTFQW